MSPHAYTEDQLVEQPAIGLFAELGWQTVSAMEEVFGASSTLGRETSGALVLIPRLRAALERLNPQMPAEAIASAVDELTRDRSAMRLAGANREVCALLKDGVKVTAPDRERGGVIVDYANVFASLEKALAIYAQGKGSDLERFKAAVKAQLARMVRLNRTRADYLKKFEALIEAYNSGSRNIEEIFKDLLALTQTLTNEQDRHLRENLIEEELTVFDILTRPGPKLSTEEPDEGKKVARQLLDRLHTLLVLDWRKRSSARAKVRLAIEDTLDDGHPRAYTKKIYNIKCEVLFEHVYESYQGDGSSVYAETR